MSRRAKGYVSPKIKPTSRKYPLVEIIWNDAWSGAGWHPVLTHEPLTCVTVGYLINRNKLGCTTAVTLDEAGVTGGVSFRPQGMIVSVRTIQRARK